MSRDIVSNDNKRKRKAQHCDVEGMGEVICDYEQHGATIVSNRVTIPEANKHLNLVGKALCRKHYNKLIVNAKKSTEGSVCSHPKHEIYESTARPGKKETKVRKVPERLVKYFELPHTALMCRHCLYKSDNDPEYVDSPNYLLPIEKLSNENIRKFQGKSYVLRNDIIYSESQFQELESAYHDVCAELDETRLGMSTALYLSPDINSPLK